MLALHLKTAVSIPIGPCCSRDLLSNAVRLKIPHVTGSYRNLHCGTSHLVMGYRNPRNPHVALGYRNLHCTPPSYYDEYDNKIWYAPGERPMSRFMQTFKTEIARMKRRSVHAEYDVYRREGKLSNVWRNFFEHELLPYECAFLIVGGGVVGSSVAFWLKQRMREEEVRIVVIERDDTFSKSSSILGVGGLRQQFSVPESIQLAQFSAEFLRHAGEHLKILDCDPPDIPFTPMGYLFLVDSAEKKEQMEKDHKVQLTNGAKVKLMAPDELQASFPFMNFDGITLGSLGLQNEGVFDSWSFLSALREKNLALGVQYVKAEVTNFYFESNLTDESILGVFDENERWQYQRLMGVEIKPHRTAASPRRVRTNMVFNCAGPWAGEVAGLAGIGHKSDLLAVPLPVVPRKRYVFSFYCPEGPGLDMPFMVDPSGVWCRREGSGYLYHCGMEPNPEEDAEMDHSNLNVDNSFFHEKIQPILVKRVPAFETLRLKHGWAGYHDYNYWDGNPIIGSHFVFENLVNVCGFGGSGIQQAIAVGRGLMESVYDGAYINVNMGCFDMHRFIHTPDVIERIRI